MAFHVMLMLVQNVCCVSLDVHRREHLIEVMVASSARCLQADTMIFRRLIFAVMFAIEWRLHVQWKANLKPQISAYICKSCLICKCLEFRHGLFEMTSNIYIYIWASSVQSLSTSHLCSKQIYCQMKWLNLNWSLPPPPPLKVVNNCASIERSVFLIARRDENENKYVKLLCLTHTHDTHDTLYR